MKYQERIDHNQGIVVGVIHNLSYREEFDHIALVTQKTRIKALELGYSVLFELHNSTEIYVSSVIDIFHWPKDYYSDQDKELLRVPTAHVLFDMDKQYLREYSSLWQKNGFNVKLFNEGSEAIDWLMQNRAKMIANQPLPKKAKPDSSSLPLKLQDISKITRLSHWELDKSLLPGQAIIAS